MATAVASTLATTLASTLAVARSGSEAVGEANEVVSNVVIVNDVDFIFGLGLLFFAVVASLPPLRKLQAYALLATDARGFDELVRTELSRDGPGLLYSSILASAQPAVAEAVERCLSASPEAAVVVNCAKGKDRTGIVSALVGLEAGDGDDVVVAEYARSESLLKDRGGDERTGSMDWSKLQGSPMEAMVEALGWLRREHGTVENYLKT